MPWRFAPGSMRSCLFLTAKNRAQNAKAEGGSPPRPWCGSEVVEEIFGGEGSASRMIPVERSVCGASTCTPGRVKKPTARPWLFTIRGRSGCCWRNGEPCRKSESSPPGEKSRCRGVSRPAPCVHAFSLPQRTVRKTPRPREAVLLGLGAEVRLLKKYSGR